MQNSSKFEKCLDNEIVVANKKEEDNVPPPFELIEIEEEKVVNQEVDPIIAIPPKVGKGREGKKYEILYYPLILSYSCTVHKSQGQTLKTTV